MNCPYCGHSKDKVVDSRESGEAIRRRRECLACERRFTSYERIEEIPYMVVKKDGRREGFDRQKLTAGLHRACEKRPIPARALTSLVEEVEQMVQDSPDREVEAQRIGETVMERLKEVGARLGEIRNKSSMGAFRDAEWGAGRGPKDPVVRAVIEAGEDAIRGRPAAFSGLGF